MASALIVLFLSCWLAGQSWVSERTTDPTQMANMTTTNFPNSTGPGTTEAGGRNSTSTLPERGGSDWTQRRTTPALTHSSSMVTGGSDWTQRRTTLAPNHPGSTEPGTESGCTKSLSTPLPETGRTDSTQLGTTPASTHPLHARPSTRTGGRESSSNQLWKQPHPGGPTNWVAFLSTGSTKPPLRGTGGPEPSAAPGLTRPIIAGVSAAAAGLVVLLVAFLCYRRTRGNSTIDDGKEMQTLEPDSGTYAELDRQTLQPNVYDMINMSQGVPQ